MAREAVWTGEIIPNGGLNDAVSPTSDEVSPDQWTAASNVEPMADGVRRRRGSAAASDTPTQEVALQFIERIDKREYIDATSEYIAQAIEPTEEIYVDQVSVRLSATSGTPIGEVEVGIFTDNAGEPSTTAVQHGAFADYSTITAEEIQQADAKHTASEATWFVFKSSAGKATLAASTTYWIVTRHSDATATGNSNISISERSTPPGRGPTQLQVTPSIWIDPDAIEADTGTSDDANTAALTLIESTGNHPGGFAPTGTNGVVLRTKGGVANINGHAWIYQPAIAATNALSTGGSAQSTYRFAGNFSMLAVYTGQVATHVNWMIGRKISGEDSGIGVPQKTVAGVCWMSTESEADQQSSTSQDVNDADVKIIIASRSGSTTTFYGTLADDTADTFGTITTGEALEFDGPLRAGSGSTTQPGVGIVQLVIFDGAMSTEDRNDLYDWAANRFGLTASNHGEVGEVAYSTDGSTWTNVPAADLHYRVYSGVGEITAICDYQKSDGTQRHLIVADKNVYKNVDGTISMVDGMNREGLNDSTVASQNGNIPSWANGGDRLFITDGSVEAKKYYIDNDGVERWEWEGLFRPVTIVTVAQATGSGDPIIRAGGNAEYFFDYYLYNSRTGARSQSNNLGVDNQGVTLDGVNDHIDIGVTGTGLPTSPQNPGEGATDIRIMIKEPGSSIYRLAKTVPLGTTSTTVEQSDFPLTIEDEYNHTQPDVHHVRLYAENRNFIAHTRVDDPDSNVGGTIELPWRMKWSAINGITPYIESYPALQYRDFDKSDRISALAFMPPRTLIVGMTRSIVAVDARRPGTSDVLELSGTIGVAHHRSIIVIDKALYWLSDNPRGFYMWAPGMNEPQRMRGADKVLSNLDQTRFVLASTARLPEDKDRSQWWTLLSSDGATTHDTILVHDRALDSWTVFNKPSGRDGSIIGTILEGGVTKMYLGGGDGIEREQDTGDTDDGVDYTGSVSLKAFDFQQQGMTKRERGIQTIVEGSDDSDLTFSLEVDLGNRSTKTATIDASPAGGDRIVKTHERARGHIFRPIYSGKKPWRIKDISLNIQPTDRT